jgi:hypothetical protein
MQVGSSLFILLYAAQSQSNLLGHIPKAGGIPVFNCYLTNGLPLILHLLHTLKTSIMHLYLFFLLIQSSKTYGKLTLTFVTKHRVSFKVTKPPNGEHASQTAN